MRLVSLALAAAAAFALPGAASADQECVPVYAGAGVCVYWTCNDHHCINRTYTSVNTTCQHPFNATCRTVYLGGVTR